MRWDLIERFDVLKKKEYARARRSFSGTEDFFKEHFPGKPLVPESLMIEMVAQAGGVLFGLGLDFKKEVVLAKIAEAAFARPVAPPCELVVEARIEEEREEGAWVAGSVSWEGSPVGRARMLLVTMDSLNGNGPGLVFNEKFLKHYDIHRVARLSEALPS